MANVKGNALPAAASVALTDILIVVNPTTGIAYRATASQLMTFIGGQSTVENATATDLTITELNTDYPNAQTGFKVICANLSLIYEKTATTWISYSFGTVSA